MDMIHKRTQHLANAYVFITVYCSMLLSKKQMQIRFKDYNNKRYRYRNVDLQLSDAEFACLSGIVPAVNISGTYDHIITIISKKMKITRHLVKSKYQRNL